MVKSCKELQKDITLLRGAIKKWSLISVGLEFDFGPLNCPLCQEYKENSCEGCPVCELTGDKYCQQTPYEDWNRYARCVSYGAVLYTRYGPYKTVFNGHSRTLANRELMFLQHLLEDYKARLRRKETKDEKN